MLLFSVILNYNSAEDCRRCVADLQQQTVASEIVIVDNCSSEEDRAAVEALCRETGCTFIAATENRGYNAGNNIGMRYAVKHGGKYILIANPDMQFPQEDFIARLVAKMEEDPEIVAIGGDIRGLDGASQSPMGRDGGWRESLCWISGILHRKRAKSEEKNYLDRTNESHYCAKLTGSCLMLRASYMAETGYFDEGVFLYCEEAILSRRVERDGKRMYYLHEAQCVHAHRASEKGDPVRRFRNWKRSRHYFIDHYSGDSLPGRLIAKASMSAYTALACIALRIRAARE